MTDKPEIKVGQRWVTHGAGVVRILATDGRVKSCPVIVEDEYGGIECVGSDGSDETDDNGTIYLNDYHLVALAPTTLKRTVALYRSGFNGELSPEACVAEVSEASDHWHCISEPVEIEFTLLPGEDA